MRLLVLLLVVGCDPRPTTATCSTYVERLDKDGRFRCAGSPDTLYAPRVDRIYCTGGTHPIRVNAYTVGCQR